MCFFCYRIEKIWDTCQGNHNPYIHASLPQFADHEFPVFKNLNFVFSDSYALDEKNYYTKFLKDNGRYKSTLNVNDAF